MSVEKKAQFWHRPDWHPSLNEILGPIVGQYGYITSVGTFHLLGPIHENPDFPKAKNDSKISGPTQVLSAQSSIGFV